ncbi:response regulator transcription factor [Sulfurospirillum arcachonense]|uniref:response regulator transcription factor n=1 Tax=Sulfurospirillum arcachonense TaxID=57666 RepID=UPI0004B25BED|nr:response regulator transcription factor [Sulfurospirillum arcachonense]
MRVLILEDNQILSSGLSGKLTAAGYAVDVFCDGADGDSVLEYQQYDLLILDLGLPGIDGIDILKKLRANQKKILVLIISARDQLDQKILGLESGADDYICKPFALDEVVARVNALFRRLLQNGQELIKLNSLEFDSSSRTLTKNGKRVELSSRELSVFEYLLVNINKVVSKENIVEHIASFDDDISPTTIETYISRLRKKLGDEVSLKTVRGLGYILNQIHL